MVMTIVHAYTLLLEAAALATSFSMLWLSFWLRDRHRRHHHLLADFASDQQDGANVGPLLLASAVSGTRLTIDVASSDVQPLPWECSTDDKPLQGEQTNALSSNQ